MWQLIQTLSPSQVLEVGIVAFAASIVGGMAGYGTGLLLPLVLVPVIGAEATVPVISVTALFTNFGRAVAMRHALNWRAFWRFAPFAIPGTLLSAWAFTLLNNQWAQLVIGLVLMVLVPLRRLLRARGLGLPEKALPLAGTAYGALAGGTTGVGVILVSILMSAGLAGNAVIATDAAISLLIGVAKASTFATFGALTPSLLVFAVLVGLITIPGAFIARLINDRLSMSLHTALLDGTVLLGGGLLVFHALT